jgi:hypothetical protein
MESEVALSPNAQQSPVGYKDSVADATAREARDAPEPISDLAGHPPSGSTSSALRPGRTLAPVSLGQRCVESEAVAVGSHHRDGDIAGRAVDGTRYRDGPGRGPPDLHRLRSGVPALPVRRAGHRWADPASRRHGKPSAGPCHETPRTGRGATLAGTPARRGPTQSAAGSRPPHLPRRHRSASREDGNNIFPARGVKGSH